MSHPILVITDPPHGTVDPEAVSATLGISVENAAAKIAFPAPEVLKATDDEPARTTAARLGAAGLAVVVVDGGELASIPPAERVQELTFEDGGLRAVVPSGTVELDYRSALLGVYCRPPASFLASLVQQLAASPGDAEVAEWMPRIDLFVEQDGRPRRLSIVQDPPADDGPDAAVRAAQAQEISTVVEELGRRFGRFELDRRLENVRPRRRFQPGERGFDLDLRKLYSFGTLLLRHVLESISPDLRDVTHYEYGVRVAGALHRQRRAGTA